MKFDTQTTVVLAVCLILLLMWPTFFPAPKPLVLEPETEDVSSVDSAFPSSTTAADSEVVKTASDSPVAQTTEPVRATERTSERDASLSDFAGKPFSVPSKLPEVALENERMTVAIDPNTGSIASIRFHDYINFEKTADIVFDPSGVRLDALALSGVGDWVPEDVADCTPSSDGTELTLVRRFRSGAGALFELRQTWKLGEGYVIACDIAVVNPGTAELVLDDFRVRTGGMLPVRYLCGDDLRRDVHHFDALLIEGDAVLSFDAQEKKNSPFPLREARPVRWISVSNKYFAFMLLPSEPLAEGFSADRTEAATFRDVAKELTHPYRLDGFGDYGPVRVEPGGDRKFSLRFFAGPKSIPLLRALDPKAGSIMRLAWWSWLEWISQMLLLGLIALKSICNSWGMSIVILTVIVRTVFWPITQKANASMRKMQKIQPLMQEIRQKYKDNPQLMNTKVMELYREQKVNPLGGCLPILLQIPVFIALYCTLDGSVELRHASFLWAKDLSQPDTIAVIPGIGLAINPLVLVWTVLLVVQQVMTPTAMEPAQQKMMLAMPVVMLYFLYSLPSGLTLYWTVSQIISIAQLRINKVLNKDEDTKPALGGKGK